MGVMDWFKGAPAQPAPLEFGRLDPYDPYMFWQALDDHARATQQNLVPQFCAGWGFRDASHWGRIQATLGPKYGPPPTPQQPARLDGGKTVYRLVPGAELIEMNGDGHRRWNQRLDLDLPREQWRDEWGPLRGPSALDDFVFHEQVFDERNRTDPDAAEAALQKHGYAHVGHFYYVRATVLKHYGTPHGPSLHDASFSSQQYMNAVMAAAARKREGEQRAAVAANPGLLAPVEGVDVDTYALLASSAARQIGQDQFLALLAQHRLDVAAWERVNKTWTDRMSKDTTGAIATAYSKAFMSSPQQTYAAAGQAAAATGFDGSAAGGAEPIPFEKFCELSGAMSAWSKTGQDVNALLKARYDMTAVDYSTVSTWWLTQLTANLGRFNEYNQKVAWYEAQIAGAQPKHDQDLTF